MKKLLAICLTFIMVISVLAVPAFAATVEVEAKTLVNQDFYAVENGTNVALTDVPDGWTLSGKLNTNGKYGADADGGYEFGANGIRATRYDGFTLYKNEQFNAGKASYTFSATLAHNGGISYLHFGSSTVAKAISTDLDDGYTMKIDRVGYNTGLYTIYKNGNEIGSLVDTDTSYGFQGNRTFTFRVTSEGITVTGAGAEFTYADKDPITKGYVGIKLVDNNGNKGNLKAMSLTTDAYSYKVDDTQATTGAYAKIVTPARAVVDLTNIGFTSKGTYSAAADLTVPSDETVKISVEAANWIYRDKQVVNFLGYSITARNTGVAELRKGTELIASSTNVQTDWGVLSSGVYQGEKTLNITLTPDSISADINGTTTVFDNVPIVDRSNSGEFSFTYTDAYNNLYGKNLKTMYLGYAEKENTYTDFLLDKTFTANDTEASVEADGFVVTDGTTFSVDGAANTGNAVSIEYNALDFGGKYTVEAVMRKDAGTQTILVNKDGDSYYGLSFGNNNCQATKYVDGKAAYTWDNNVSATAYLFTYGFSTFTVNVSEEANGNVKISYTAKGPGGTLTGEFEDVLSDENAVLTSGDVCVKALYGTASTRYIKSLKVYPTSVADPVYEGNFDIGGTAVSAAAKGVTYFTFPVTMLGQSPDFIAALYEDGKMTDIKFFDAATANEGAVELFDTTNSKANKVEIKVFVWDTLEGMIPVLAPFTLK